jgi:hypothetical protein
MNTELGRSENSLDILEATGSVPLRKAQGNTSSIKF